MRIDQALTPGTPAVSFEFFPPKSEEGFKSLYKTIDDLHPLSPSYVSVTYGAGGSTRAPYYPGCPRAWASSRNAP